MFHIKDSKPKEDVLNEDKRKRQNRSRVTTVEENLQILSPRTVQDDRILN